MQGAERQPSVEVQRFACDVDAQVRIEGVDRALERLALGESGEGGPQDQGALVVDLGDARERGLGVDERFEPADTRGAESCE